MLEIRRNAEGTVVIYMYDSNTAFLNATPRRIHITALAYRPRPGLLLLQPIAGVGIAASQVTNRARRALFFTVRLFGLGY